MAVVLSLGTAGFFLFTDDGTLPEDEYRLTGPIETSTGPVLNAEEWLDDLSQEWAAEIPDQDVTVSEEPACYFVLNEEELVTNQVACGGVRHLGVEDGHVWDIAEFTVTETENGEAVNAASHEFVEESSPRPESYVVDAEGEEAPAEIEDLEAPQYPLADPGLLLDENQGQQIDAAITESSVPGEAEQVVTLGGQLQLTSFETASVATLNDRDYAPAEGESFRVVEYSFNPRDISSTPPDGELFVNIDGENHKLSDLTASGESGRFLVSASDETHLRVVSHGYEQEISLSTGERVPTTPAAGLYRENWYTEPDYDFSIDEESGRLDGDRFEVEAELTLEEAALNIHQDSATGATGWPDEGNIWLIMQFHIELDGPDDDIDFESGTWRFEVTDDQGNTHEVEHESEAQNWDMWPEGTMLVAVQVPVDTEDYEISAELEATFADGSETTTLDFETEDSYEVEFPHELSD